MKSENELIEYEAEEELFLPQKSVFLIDRAIRI